MIENKAPDTILFNGKIYTVDQQRTIASAVAFCKDKILAVGSDAEILPMAGGATKVIDLCGKLVLPGLNDSHAHPLWMARQMEFAAFTDARSIGECLDILAKKAAETPAGEWIVVSMTWHETQLKEGRLPTRKEIDSVCPDNPVCIPRGGHLKVLNSKAFEAIGVTDDVADPDGGKFGRDADGKLDGMAIDAAADLVDPFLPVISPEIYARSLEKVGNLLASRGVTTSAELGLLGGNRPAQESSFNTLMSLYDEGKMHIRMAAMIFAGDYEMAKWGIKFGRTLKNSDCFRFQGIKLVTDGGAEGASLRDPYMVIEGLQTNPDFHGVAMWPKSRAEEFKRVMQLCTDEDVMLQVHINGDQSADDTIPLLIEHAKKYDVSKRDWTICHLPFATDEQLDAIKEAKLNVSVQHQPYLLGLNMRRFWGDERANSQENYRKYIDKGLRMGGGTDYPIGPASPFQSIQFMVDRKIVDGSVMGAESAITLEEAVYLWTQGSANIEGWGKMIGSVEPGKKADLVVLNQDIFAVPTEEIGKTTVSSTWLGGECVYQQ